MIGMAERTARLTEKFPMPQDVERLKEIIVYISSKCQADIFFGATKLNKILFKADFRSYKMRGRPITGTAYFRLRDGPAPRAMVPVMRELHIEGRIATQRAWIMGKEQKRPIALEPAKLKIFDGDEIAIVDQVIEDLKDKSATEVSIESHGVQWETRSDRDAIPYETAYLSDDLPTVDDMARADELATRFGLSAG